MLIKMAAYDACAMPSLVRDNHSSSSGWRQFYFPGVSGVLILWFFSQKKNPCVKSHCHVIWLSPEMKELA